MKYCKYENFSEGFIFMKLRICEIEITLSFTDIGKFCHCHEFFNTANISFNPIRENKILMKISKINSIGQIGTKKASGYDQEIPQSHTADQPTAP